MPQLVPEVGSPDWWLVRLLRRLHDRAPALEEWNDYYEGRQPLAFASDKFRDAFGERFPAFTSNFCELVVEGIAERLEVAGFRWGTREASAAAWEVWQSNDLDAGSQQAHQEALVKGTAYALVEPGPDGPRVTIEDALDAIVEHEPKSRRTRRAGLKRWVDDEGRLVVYLYLPGEVFKYRTANPWRREYSGWWRAPGEWSAAYPYEVLSAAKFEPLLVDGEDWPASNSLGVVPLVELPNRPRLRGSGGRSEVQSIRSNQDAVNKYRTDALVASEFAAFPQRYLLNFEPETDPESGRAKEPFRAAIDRLWTVPPPDPDLPDSPEPKFGQFQAASLEPYERMITLEVGHIASISRLPYHYLLGEPSSVPPSAESIKSGEVGLVRKVGRAAVYLGEGWEEVIRLGLQAQENGAWQYRAGETVWADAEARNEAVRTDAVVKLRQSGIIDDELAWEMAGLTRQQIAALIERREARGAPTPIGSNGAAGTDLVPAPTGPRMSPAIMAGGQPT